ncbi:MAG: hypothetical protein LUQ71_00215 [Methanoregula sp.]|nr:hypothetical protein [Methanoregula sp.]
MINPFFSAGNSHEPRVRAITIFFRAVLGMAVVLALTILLLPQQVYLAISNYLQIITAFAGAIGFLYIWYRYGRQEYLLWAAGAFALWGISNSAWYVNIFLGQRNAVFPSLIDIGIIASIIILSVAFRKGLPQKQVVPHILLLVLAISLIIPLGVIVTQGISVPSLVTLLYFVTCGSLIVVALNRSSREYPHILTGVLLFAIAFMVYPLREMFFITNPVLNVIGTLVFAGFSLIVIGMFAVSVPETSSP